MRRIERLAHGNRWRRRHPGEKLFLGGGLLVLSLALPPWPGAALVLGAAIGSALLGARLPVADYARLLAVPAGFLLAGSAALAVSVQDGPGALLRVDAGGVVIAAEASLRAMAATASLLLVVLTTPVAELLVLLRRAGMPASLVELMLLVYRFVAIAWLAVEGGRMAQAGRLGYSGFQRSIRSLGLLAASLLPRVLDRAGRMQIGLAARGWRGELRVLTPQHAVSPRFLLAAAGLEAAIIALALGSAPLASMALGQG